MKFSFKIGDSVRVRPGIIDPHFGTNLAGRQGRIIEMDESDDGPVICIEWDSATLKSISRSEIAKSEKRNLDWAIIWLLQSEVDPVHPRENDATDELMKKHGPSVANKAILVTITGEPYQPTRLYYELFQKEKVADTFAKLRCMDYDKSKQRWVWLYSKEAKKLKFTNSYSSIPWRKRPIVLGSFFSKSNNHMFLNLNSFDRAIKAIEFFDKHLDRSFAEVTDIEVVNRFFDIPFPGEVPRHEHFFDKKPVVKRDGEASLKELMTKALAIEDPKERAAFGMSYFERMSKKPLPEVERFPTLYYEEGIGGLELSLKVRHIIAYHNWLGNADYSYHDLMQEIMPSINGRTT